MRSSTAKRGVDHSGHRQRIKNRFLEEGIDSFNYHQVLEMLLFYAIPYRDTNEIAHKLLEKYGSIACVFDADYGDLTNQQDIGPHAALLLNMIPSLSRVYMKDRWKGKPRLDGARSAGLFAMSLFVGQNYESFYLICLDTQNHVVKPVMICTGTINQTMVYPRLIIENALRFRAGAVILSHNHPGGSTAPSPEDIDMTNRIKEALLVINVKVIDHIIVAGNEYFSFAADKLLP